jgi:hypothetical protein
MRTNEHTLCAFTYNSKIYSGQFSVSVGGEPLEDRWRFWLGDAAVKPGDEIDATIGVKYRR